MTRPDPSDTLAHGKYMTTIAACVACHTPIEKGALVAGMEYAGGAKFPMPGGDLRSMNITPDEETGIGTWTKEQFVARFKANATPEAKKHRRRPERLQHHHAVDALRRHVRRGPRRDLRIPADGHADQT
ncbi:MAG: hypothetical protein M5R36_12150 [Deltaproteobacteria bacterium]|nr:hypothetical protein [Deltaproteobacteria bacterium]